MSEQWLFFPCQMGERRAFIFYDHGISESIDSVAPRQLLKVKLRFKEPKSDGLPAGTEFDKLTALEDDLGVLVQQHESLYVGRATVDGHRYFFVYTPDSENVWSPKLRALGDKHGYELEFWVEADDEHNGYWKELFPTPDDWQVIKDLRVMDALKGEGDDGTASRCIEHWAFFPSSFDADKFSEWARKQGYQSSTVEMTEDGKFLVRLSHDGTIRLEDITSHTIRLRRKATELDGDYDGWETEVCKRSA
jgi:hypothetical protein